MKYATNQTGSITLRHVTPEDVSLVASLMRQQDREDFAAVGITDPLEAVQQSITGSLQCFTVEKEGGGIGLCGILQKETPEGVPVALPWATGTEALTAHQGDLTRAMLGILQDSPHVIGWVVRRSDTETPEILTEAGFIAAPMSSAPERITTHYSLFAKGASNV